MRFYEPSGSNISADISTNLWVTSSFSISNRCISPNNPQMHIHMQIPQYPYNPPITPRSWCTKRSWLLAASHHWISKLPSTATPLQQLAFDWKFFDKTLHPIARVPVSINIGWQVILKVFRSEAYLWSYKNRKRKGELPYIVYVIMAFPIVPIILLGFSIYISGVSLGWSWNPSERQYPLDSLSISGG